MVPAGSATTPTKTVHKLNQCGPRRSQTEGAQLVDRGGMVLVGSSSADFGKFIADEIEKFGKVIWAASIKPE